MAGLIFYRGKSRIDGSDIVGIITGVLDKKKSNNIKTGEMAQTWILNTSVNPVEALKTGQDKSICGDCKYRPVNSGVCYVNVGQAPNNIYKAFLRGNYKDMASYDVVAGMKVRFGSYGDPTAIPVYIWQAMAEKCDNYTGYTHQWLNKENDHYKKFCMASVDTPEEFMAARTMGWRTFRVTNKTEKLFTEFVCPASKEGGLKKTCSQCMACNGSRREDDFRGTPVILVHGAKFKSNRYVQLSAKQKER